MFHFRLVATVAALAFTGLSAHSDPEFPLRNIDTITVKKQDAVVDGKTVKRYQTLTPHLPVHDMTQDGRIGLLRRTGAGGAAPFYVMKPENIKHHLKHGSNEKMGANVISGTPDYSFSPDYYRNNGLKKKLKNYTNSRTILCEKTQENGHNPKACGSGKNFDCYKVTLVTRFNDQRTKGSEKVRFASVDAEVKVQSPKTKSAKIISVTLDKDTIELGPDFHVPKLAEPVIAGDGRLIVARVHNADLSLHDGTVVEKANLAYNVYGKDKAQCNVNLWKNETWRPIAYAPYDTTNDMPGRYKFARFPFRDTLGNLVPKDGVLGGSYPWIDKAAANLFFEAYGRGAAFYNYKSNGAQRTTPYPDHSTQKPSDKDDAMNYESIGARTNGISMMGFWTQGKMIHFDGLLNNVDFNFTVSDRYDGSTRLRVHRKLAIYNSSTTPSGQTYENVGGNREVGSDVLKNEYHDMLTPNSSFLGSWENRFNYLTKALPVTQRDIVWHFSSTRHTDEIAFDDYMNPYMIINAEMTGAVAYEDGKETMKHYDGFDTRGLKDATAGDLSSFPTTVANDPVLIQNAVSAHPKFIKQPQYGRPVGNIRLEPIAKGGIHGKGLWLDGGSGVQFKIPSQADTKFSIKNQKDWFLSLFVDSRKSPGTAGSNTQIIVELNDSGRRIELAKWMNRTTTPNNAFDVVLLRDGDGKLMSVAKLPSLYRNTLRVWRNVGIQFRENHMPDLYIDGQKVATFDKRGSYTNAQVKAFFRPQPYHVITLGTADTSSIGFKGWVDDFKLVARAPTWEEKCNYARGTYITAPSSGYWKNKANTTPDGVHNQISSLTGYTKGTKFLCYVRYGAQTSLTAKEDFAHRKNLPSNTTSVRQRLTHENQLLKFGKKRPDYTSNSFCLSCHTPKFSFTKSALDIRALQPGTVNAEDDARRQPMQPAKMIRGVIPANYFGTGKPSSVKRGNYKVDQWILGR